MYQQICNILKQNNIPYEHILWVDESGSLQVDENLNWTQFIEDTIEPGGLLFYFSEEKRYFKITQQFHLGMPVFLMKEIKSE